MNHYSNMFRPGPNQTDKIVNDRTEPHRLFFQSTKYRDRTEFKYLHKSKTGPDRTESVWTGLNYTRFYKTIQIKLD